MCLFVCPCPSFNLAPYGIGPASAGATYPGQWLCCSPLGGQTFALYQWISVWLVSCHYWVMNLYYFAPCLAGTWYLKGCASNYFYEGNRNGDTHILHDCKRWLVWVLFKLLVPGNHPSTLHHTCPCWWSECSPGEFLHVQFISAISRDEYSLARMHTFLLPRGDWSQRALLCCPFPGSCY